MSAPTDIINPLDSVGAVPQLFTLMHLELLHHAQEGLVPGLILEELQATVMTDTVFSNAFQSPFLMDQILALSATHLSVLRPDMRATYLSEATQLQTRGLTLFNSLQQRCQTEDSYPRNLVAEFLYSSFLGLHVMFETLSEHIGVNEVLDRLADYLLVHRGVRTILTGGGWSIIEKELHPFIGGLLLDHSSGDVGEGRECDSLSRLLHQADLSESTITMLWQVVGQLQWVFDNHQRVTGKFSQLSIVMAWPIMIPAPFSDMLRQRQPEALVILAYYSVLLHKSRSFWIVGDGGQFLLESISTYIGSYWDEWLTWPREMIATGDIGAS
jgi:hypothetical protein